MGGQEDRRVAVGRRGKGSLLGYRRYSNFDRVLFHEYGRTMHWEIRGNDW